MTIKLLRTKEKSMSKFGKIKIKSNTWRTSLRLRYIALKIKLLRFVTFLRLQLTVDNPPVYEYRVWKGNVNDLLLIFFVITPVFGVGVVVLICYLVGPYGFNPKPLP